MVWSAFFPMTGASGSATGGLDAPDADTFVCGCGRAFFIARPDWVGHSERGSSLPSTSRPPFCHFTMRFLHFGLVLAAQLHPSVLHKLSLDSLLSWHVQHLPAKHHHPGLSNLVKTTAPTVDVPPCSPLLEALSTSCHQLQDQAVWRSSLTLSLPRSCPGTSLVPYQLPGVRSAVAAAVDAGPRPASPSADPSLAVPRTPTRLAVAVRALGGKTKLLVYAVTAGPSSQPAQLLAQVRAGLEQPLMRAGSSALHQFGCAQWSRRVLHQ